MVRLVNVEAALNNFAGIDLLRCDFAILQEVGDLIVSRHVGVGEVPHDTLDLLEGLERGRRGNFCLRLNGSRALGGVVTPWLLADGRRAKVRSPTATYCRCNRHRRWSAGFCLPA
jgi:hypothetical protein